MTEVEAINKALAAHVEAVNSRNIEANLAGFTDDQIYMPPGMMPIQGKPEFENLVHEFNKDFEVQITMEAEETIVSGSWAYQWGFLIGEMRALATGETTPMDWKFVYIYQLQDDGTWKIHRDMYNNNVANGT